MKQSDDLKNLSVEELHEKKKKLKGMIIGIAIPMALAFIALIYLAVKNKNYALIAVAIGCSITLLPGFIVLNGINNEIKNRSESKSLN